MANFFEGVGNALMHPVKELGWMWDSTKGVLSGDKKLKDIPGDHQEMMNDITVPILGNNKLAKNSDAVAGAVVGGVLAAPLVAGATGGSGGAGVGGFGTEGAFSKAFQPQVSSVSGWNKFKGGVSNMFDFGTQDLGSLYKDIDFNDPANDDILGMISEVEDDIAAGKSAKKGVDLEAIGKMLQSIKSPEQYRIQHSGGRAGGGFRFDQSQYKNQLAQREFDQMYGASPYKPLV